MQAFPTSNAKPTACPGWTKNPNKFKSWLILQGIQTSPGSAVMMIWALRRETNIYAPRCSSAAREEPTAVNTLSPSCAGRWNDAGAGAGHLSTCCCSRYGATEDNSAEVGTAEDCQSPTWCYETSGLSFIPHLTRHNCKWALLLCQHHGTKCVLVREAQTPQNSVPCAADHKG